MGYDVAKLVMQSSSAAYNPLKDMILYLKNKAKYVKDLEDNLTKLTAEMTTFYARKKQIDRILETAVSKEKSNEYHILLTQIEAFHKKYDKFIDKYHKDCQNLPSVIPEPEALTESKVIDEKQTAIQEPDISTASNVIDALQARKPSILTRKFFKLAKLSKDINKLHDHISRVTDRMKVENVMLEKVVEPVQVKHDDIDLPSFSEYVNKILRYLSEDENRSLIGIVGPIGVGKTTVMKKLNNQLKDTSSPLSRGTMRLKFDVVIWINYHKQQDAEGKIVEMMQDVIMGRLKLNREKSNSIEENADIISRALWHKKYILLIDQVSSTINLNEVGIDKDHKFGKVVVASTSKKVIKQMTDHQVEIWPLLKDEALDLFQKVCGTIYDARIKDIADNIVKSCGGLPLVIKLVATYLKGEKDENVWSDVKRVLQSETKAAKMLKLGGVGNAYKLVYDKLEGSYMKCLLFAALFPSDHKIYKDYLVECWNAESFLELDIPELRSARERGATVLKELTDQYLLENYSDKHVKMPVHFRTVALAQKYPGEENCIIWVSEKDKLPSAETWKTTRRMSLISCKSKLPESPESHNILTLLLQWNPKLVTLGDLFFLNMQNLCILDLNQTGIMSLPSSISSLINLISLYLNNCSRLTQLPPKVKMLKKLEVLDIRGTSIRRLPDEMGDMSHLRCLRVSFSHKGCNRNSKGKKVEMMIPLNIIGRLQQLEELTIEAGCCSQGWNDIADQIAVEIACLEKLSTLSFHFPSVHSLKKFVTDSKSWKNTETHWNENTFRSFKIFIGCCETQHPYDLDISGVLAERQLRFSTNEEISSVREVLRQTSSFELVGHFGVESLSEFDLTNTGALKVCIVERCKKLISAVDASKINEMQAYSMGKTVCAVLQCLEKLHLFDLQLLQSIWKGSVFTGSLANLKVLTLSGCPELTEILNHELAKALSSLKHLKVENCSKIVEIVKAEIPDGQSISEDVDLSDILHKVKTIELVNLPELQSICKSTSMNWKSLRKIVTISCNKLRNLALTLSNAGKLETIKCEASWWTALQLPDEEKNHFLPHCDFIVMEERLAIGACHEGESSNGRSVDPQASDTTVSKSYNGKRRLEEVMPSNGRSNDLKSNISSVDHADRHKEENPPIHEDLLESNIVAEAESGVENPKARSMCEVEYVTSQSTNTNVPAENETLSLSDERLGKSGSVNIHSSEIQSLTGTVEQILLQMESSTQRPVIQSSGTVLAGANEQ